MATLPVPDKNVDLTPIHEDVGLPKEFNPGVFRNMLRQQTTPHVPAAPAFDSHKSPYLSRPNFATPKAGHSFHHISPSLGFLQPPQQTSYRSSLLTLTETYKKINQRWVNNDFNETLTELEY